MQLKRVVANFQFEAVLSDLESALIGVKQVSIAQQLKQQQQWQQQQQQQWQRQRRQYTPQGGQQQQQMR